MPFMSSQGGQYGYGRQKLSSIVTSNMLLYLDATNNASYPGSGTTWTDLSPNANNATSLAGVTYSSANSGYLSFNGTSGSGSLVSSKYNTTYTGKTVFLVGQLASDMGSATFRAFLGDSTGGRNFNFYLYRTPSNTYQFHFSSGGTGTFSSNLPFTAGTWFTAAFTHATDGTLIYYFNGVQVSQTTQAFAQYQSGTEWIGRADNYWNGPLATICVYKSALSATDILTNHNSVKNRYGI